MIYCLHKVKLFDEHRFLLKIKENINHDLKKDSDAFSFDVEKYVYVIYQPIRQFIN